MKTEKVLRAVFELGRDSVDDYIDRKDVDKHVLQAKNDELRNTISKLEIAVYELDRLTKEQYKRISELEKQIAEQTK